MIINSQTSKWNTLFRLIGDKNKRIISLPNLDIILNECGRTIYSVWKTMNSLNGMRKYFQCIKIKPVEFSSWHWFDFIHWYYLPYFVDIVLIIYFFHYQNKWYDQFLRIYIEKNEKNLHHKNISSSYFRTFLCAGKLFFGGGE